MSVNWVQLGGDDNMDGESIMDMVGSTVSINNAGDRVAIALQRADTDGLIDNGLVRVFYYNSGTSAWAQLGNEIRNENAGELAANFLSLNAVGDRIAIGIPYPSAGGGTVRVYEYNTDYDHWGQIGGDSDIVGNAGWDYMGVSVSLNNVGNRVVVGGNWTDNNGKSNNGGAWVYEYIVTYTPTPWGGTSWSSEWVLLGGYTDMIGGSDNDHAAKAVSINDAGNIVAVTHSRDDNTGGVDAGKIVVYEYNGSSAWVQLGGDNDMIGDSTDDKVGDGQEGSQ